MIFKFFNPPRRAGRGKRLATTIKTAFWAAWLAGVVALPAFGTERTWTGSAGALWSNPLNWSPVGTPLNGDDLEFLGNDSNDSMVNDVVGLSVTTLTFRESNYQLSGNPLTILPPIGTPGDSVGGYIDNTGSGGSRTITINCGLTLSPGVEIYTGAGGDEYQLAFTTSIALVLTGNIQIEGDVYLYSETQVNYDVGPLGGTDGYYDSGVLEVSGSISGTGGLHASSDAYSTFELDGASGNTFTGIVESFGGGTCILNKQSGLAVPHDLAIHNAEQVLLQHAEQITNTATVSLSDGSEFLLQGYNETVGMLVLTNVSADAQPTLVDTTGGFGAGTGTLRLTGGLSSTVDNDHVHPTIKGILSLSGFLPFNITGGSQPGLEIAANVEGNGFEMTGDGLLLLDGTNTLFGELRITAGTVQPTIAAALSPGGFGVTLNGGDLQLQALAVNGVNLLVTSSSSTFLANNQCSWSGPVTVSADLHALPQDTLLSGTTMTFSGAITGGGGLIMMDSPDYNGTLVLAGSSANTFTGPLTVYGRLLELDKSSGAQAYAGPLIVGGGTAAISEARWLNSLQNAGATVTLYANGLVNLNNFNEDFGPLTFNAGEVETGAGQLELDGPVTAYAANVAALMYGYVRLPSGYADILTVGGVGLGGSGAADLTIYATLLGPGNLQKTGDGTLGLYGNNTYTGLTLLDDGITIANTDTALGTTASGTLVQSGATLWLQSGASVVNESISLSGGGFGGPNGALRATGNVTVENPFPGIYPALSLSSGSTILIDSGSQLTVNGFINGTGPLTNTGPGELELTGGEANTYTGDAFDNQGILVLDKGNNVIAVPGNLTIGTKRSPFNNIGTTATVECLQDGAIGGTNLTVNGGSLYETESHNQTLASIILNNGSTISTANGTLTLTGANPTTVVAVNPGKSGASVISGNLQLNSGGNIAVGGRSQFLLGSGPELDLQAALGDSVPSGIVKSGAGEMRLSAANTFFSPVTVNGGKLTLSNSFALGNSTGTTVNSNSTLALEGGISIQDVSLTLNSSASPAWQSVNGSNFWNGNVILNQTAAIDIEPANGYLGSLNVFSGPGGITAAGLGTLDFEGTLANTYAGLTTVNNGVVEGGRFNTTVTRNKKGQLVTNEVAVTSFPGDVIIGSDATSNTAATLRSLRETQLTLANVAVHASGLLDLPSASGQHDPPNESLQTLTGSGLVNEGLSSMLFIFGNASFTFNGTINGAGDFTKQGSGTMTTYGNVNTTGTVQLTGGNWLLFGARHNGGIDVANSFGGVPRLGGDGTVDGTITMEVATIGVDSHFPDHQGSTLHLGSFTNATIENAVQLNMFGPSPTGGNDQITTTSGGVSLFSDTILTTSFSYPPREGDVIDLISVPSGQTIAGNFANFPDGVVTLVGTTPVLPSYEGGSSGHDFTLTVTNLALGYVGYQLAEGNGNQTVEPNECNLLYVSLVNRRSTALTITNAYLRTINTNGVVVTVPVATYPVISAGQTMTNTTPFQFSTDTNLACGGVVGFELVVGVVNEGQFAIDFSPVSGTDCSHPTGPCDSCTVASGQFTANTPTTAQPLYFVGAPSICYPPKAYPGTNPAPFLSATPYLMHNFTNSTTNLVCVTAQLEFKCSAAPTNALGLAAYLGSFDPNNPSVGYLGDIGQGGPPYPPFAFPVPAGSNFTVVVMAQVTNLPCNNYTLQLFGLPCPPPVLAIQPEPAATNQVRVNWSTAYPGFTAQQSGTLSGGTFTNMTRSPVILNSRYSLTNLPVSTTNQFFRLMK